MKKEEQKSKSHTLPFSKDNLNTWKLIKSGQKSLETRAGGPKYIDIKAGDTIVFSCLGKKFSKKVAKVIHFKTVSAMLKKYKPNEINPTLTTAKELQSSYDSFPGYKERLKEFGILVFEL